jgi:hypothetical protein
MFLFSDKKMISFPDKKKADTPADARFNFYPTALFGEAVLAIPNLAHCQAPQANAKTKACQRAKFANPQVY